jgi:hypothetical protein
MALDGISCMKWIRVTGQAVEAFSTFHLAIKAACIAELLTFQGQNRPDHWIQPMYVAWNVPLCLPSFCLYSVYVSCQWRRRLNIDSGS